MPVSDQEKKGVWKWEKTLQHAASFEIPLDQDSYLVRHEEVR